MTKVFKNSYLMYKGFKDNRLPFLFVKNPLLSSFYYSLFSNKFRREQHAVLKGKVDHLRHLKKEKANIYTLIRNTHRIEKGLLMRPRREVFALDYIKETVEAFCNIWDGEKFQKDAQFKWFHDVLSEYFVHCGNHSKVKGYQEKFLDKVEGTSHHAQELKSIPYSRILDKNSQVSYENFFGLTRHRRSVRWFLNKSVPRDLIDKALLAAGQAPSACNRQPFEYRIIDDPDLLEKVRSTPMGVKGYEHGIPVMVVVIGNLDAYFDERDRHLIYIDASLANMNFMLALETLGLSSCPINWPDIEELEIKMEQYLGLPKTQRPIMCLALGYPDPDGLVAYSEKRPLEKFRKYN
ncbi:hypothetical protein GCM10007049_04350 [Echinicola pacifica]|uniref:Nitroreductase domain-containing protein n=1 Tax=Echinicola pacifica TaxID=346377 RepID=A0A918PMN4_9BACT|nr:nitroreductase family protein [Echinicola pacifica]GGZ15389.1 hypothetical protein GCM10007049_04350 [Echinicola pacifica]